MSRRTRYSPFLSMILRHKPGKIGLELDAHGWAPVDELIQKANQAGIPLTRQLLQTIVETNDKQRFSFNQDETLIRANQGHSIPVNLGLEAVKPPAVLYHGTADRFIESIRQQGLSPRGREYVHLSSDEATAIQVGQRHGSPVVLRVRAEQMHQAGLAFYRSANGVWLTRHVPPGYLDFPG